MHFLGVPAETSRASKDPLVPCPCTRLISNFAALRRSITTSRNLIFRCEIGHSAVLGADERSRFANAPSDGQATATTHDDEAETSCT